MNSMTDPLAPLFFSCRSTIHQETLQQISDHPCPPPRKVQLLSVLKYPTYYYFYVDSFWFYLFGFYCSYLIGRKCMNILTSIAPSRLALSPMLSSMYRLSSSVIVGCFAGLSYETKSQNMYQTIPKLPLEWRKRLSKEMHSKVAKKENMWIIVTNLNCKCCYCFSTKSF